MFANAIANLFHMDNQTWAGHAHPRCFWTRLTVMPLLVLAIWSRVWLGGWSLALIAIALLWNWVNARLFSAPKSTNNWASKSVFGERLWINRQQVPIPARHRVFPIGLTGLSALGAAIACYGLWVLNLPLTLLGLLLIYIGKLWFLDRMVWLYEDMKTATPEYASWLY
ncbi:hypothetical protein C7271_23845 [filamentous cyanobacterium CCP5]|nr:hypothetical protein C7271_23845 [filamentous cyanobacterium CCP5]